MPATARTDASHYLLTCLSMANHVVVLDGPAVRFCGTDRATAAAYAGRIADADLTVIHTTGRDSRAR